MAVEGDDGGAPGEAAVEVAVGVVGEGGVEGLADGGFPAREDGNDGGAGAGVPGAFEAMVAGNELGAVEGLGAAGGGEDEELAGVGGLVEAGDVEGAVALDGG